MADSLITVTNMTKISIKIKNDYVSEKGLQHRIASLKVGSDLSLQAKPAVRTDPLLKASRDKIGQAYITERLVKLTVDDLNRIDSDPFLQKEFIEGNMIGKENSGLSFNVVKVMLKQDQKLSEDQIRYLTNIFTLYSYKGISVVPLVYYYEVGQRSRQTQGGKITYPLNEVLKPLEFNRYLEFVKGFLKEVKERKYTDQVVMSIPALLPHNKITDFLDLYKDIETPIAMQDAMGKEQIAFMDNIRDIQNGKGYSLEQKNNENYMLYGFDSKKVSFGGRPSDINPAKNIEQLLYGFSSFGAQYTWQKMRLEDDKNNRKFKPNSRIYVSNEMGYAKKDYKTALGDIQKWIQENLPNKPIESYSRYVKDYEAFKLIESSDILDESANENTLDKTVESSSLKGDVERIKRSR